MKLHWNSIIISTALAKYMCPKIKNFCWTAALEYFKYMKIPLTLFPEWIVEQYNLTRHALNGFVHLEMRRAVWWIATSRIYSKQMPKTKACAVWVQKSTNTPGLWHHDTRSVLFTLVLDNFGVKYVNADNVQHLIVSIKRMTPLPSIGQGTNIAG
jgi:hypothetical protein